MAKKDVERNRNKNLNLNGLYAVSHEAAMSNGKPRKGVYGVVRKDTPYICHAQQDGRKGPPRFKHDMTGDQVPAVLKNRILAYFGDPNNANRKTCYLAESSLYESMKDKRTTSSGKKGGGF